MEIECIYTKYLKTILKMQVYNFDKDKITIVNGYIQIILVN